MAQIDHIDDIAFSTKYPIDKVVDYIEDNFSIGAATSSGGFDVVATASDMTTHGLGYRPKPDGIWSIDGDNYYPLGTPIITDIGNLTNIDSLDELIAVYTSSTTQAGIKAYSYDQVARTIFYKLWLLYPEN